MKIELKGREVGQACLDYVTKHYKLDNTYYYNVEMRALLDTKEMLNDKQFKADFTVTVEQGRKKDD